MSDQPAPKPWAQLPDEPAACYSRFLVYRNMGPGRTLDAAYRAVKRAVEGEKRRAPGMWYRTAQAHRWQQRAGAWDINNLQEAPP